MRGLSALFIVALLITPTVARADLQVYEVESQYRQEVVSALNAVLRRQGNLLPIGTARLLPTGQILVEAPEEVQVQVAAVLDAVARSNVAPAPSVSLRYWVLLGEPGGQDGRERPPLLSGVIDELQAAHGTLGITVLDAASLISESGRQGSLNSETLEIAQTVTVSERTLNAAISFQTEHQEIFVNVTMERGEFVVLAESGIDDIPEGSGILFVVVHWPD